MKKLLIALALILALSFTLCACQGGGDTEDPTDGEGTTDSVESTDNGGNEDPTDGETTAGEDETDEVVTYDYDALDTDNNWTDNY